MKKGILVIILAVLISGCSLFSLEKGDAVLELTVRAVASRTFAEKPTWAPVALRIAQELRDANEELEIGSLRDVIFEKLPFHLLTPEEVALVQMVVPMIETRVIDRLKEKGIEAPEETKAYLGEVLTWIEQSAEAYK
jgi:hypothetical protein